MYYKMISNLAGYTRGKKYWGMQEDEHGVVLQNDFGTDYNIDRKHLRAAQEEVNRTSLYPGDTELPPSPAPLHRTPWYLRLLGHGPWYMLQRDGSRDYWSTAKYNHYFGR